MTAERIIFVPFIHAFAGVERLILGLSRFLHENGATHTVVCFSQTIDFASYAKWPLTVHELGPMRNPVAEGWALHRYLWGSWPRFSTGTSFRLEGGFLRRHVSSARLPFALDRSSKSPTGGHQQVCPFFS